jgi:hypothetical protein
MKKWSLVAVLLCGLTQSAMAFTNITKAALLGVKPTAGATTDVVLGDAVDMRGVAYGGSLLQHGVPFCTQLIKPTTAYIDGACIPVNRSATVPGQVIERRMANRVTVYVCTSGYDQGNIDIYVKSGSGMIRTTYSILATGAVMDFRGEICGVGVWGPTIFQAPTVVINFY